MLLTHKMCCRSVPQVSCMPKQIHQKLQTAHSAFILVFNLCFFTLTILKLYLWSLKNTERSLWRSLSFYLQVAFPAHICGLVGYDVCHRCRFSSCKCMLHSFHSNCAVCSIPDSQKFQFGSILTDPGFWRTRVHVQKPTPTKYLHRGPEPAFRPVVTMTPIIRSVQFNPML